MPDTAATNLSAVDQAVITQALIAAAHEMGVKLIRSAHSSIVREAEDCSSAILDRDGNVVADKLKIESLRRFKDDATEVREGYECGIGLGSFNDIKEGDIVETFEMQEKPRV